MLWWGAPPPGERATWTRGQPAIDFSHGGGRGWLEGGFTPWPGKTNSGKYYDWTRTRLGPGHHTPPQTPTGQHRLHVTLGRACALRHVLPGLHVAPYVIVYDVTGDQAGLTAASSGVWWSDRSPSISTWDFCVYRPPKFGEPLWGMGGRMSTGHYRPI